MRSFVIREILTSLQCLRLPRAAIKSEKGAGLCTGEKKKPSVTEATGGLQDRPRSMFDKWFDSEDAELGLVFCKGFAVFVCQPLPRTFFNVI